MFPVVARMNSGVYAIVNKTNGKQYIGSAKNCTARWSGHRHRLQRGTHHCRHLQSAWHKYGAAAFEFKPLVYCGAKDLILYEQIALDAFRPEYNTARVAGNTLGTKRTAESRSKIAAKATGRKWSAEAKAKLIASTTGRKLSEDRRAKLIGNKHAAGVKHSPERRAAISAFMTGRPRPKSAEQRAKIASALLGRKSTQEQRAKQSVAQLGSRRGPYKPMSAETRARAAALRARRPNPHLGLKRSAETCARIALALKGRKLLPEQKQKIGVGAQRMWSDPVKHAAIVEAQKAAWARRKQSSIRIAK